MGAAWHDEDSDTGHRNRPKLILAGRLTGSLDGRPVVIKADECGLVLSVMTFRTAWRLRRILGTLLPALRALQRCELPVRLEVAGIVVVILLPRPGALVRFLVPGLSQLS